MKLHGHVLFSNQYQDQLPVDLVTQHVTQHVTQQIEERDPPNSQSVRNTFDT